MKINIQFVVHTQQHSSLVFRESILFQISPHWKIKRAKKNQKEKNTKKCTPSHFQLTQYSNVWFDEYEKDKTKKCDLNNCKDFGYKKKTITNGIS